MLGIPTWENLLRRFFFSLIRCDCHFFFWKRKRILKRAACILDDNRSACSKFGLQTHFRLLEQFWTVQGLEFRPWPEVTTSKANRKFKSPALTEWVFFGWFNRAFVPNAESNFGPCWFGLSIFRRGDAIEMPKRPNQCKSMLVVKQKQSRQLSLSSSAELVRGRRVTCRSDRRTSPQSVHNVAEAGRTV